MRTVRNAVVGIACGLSITCAAGAVPSASAADPDNMVPTDTLNYNWSNGCIPQTFQTADRVCQTDNGSVTIFMQSSVGSAFQSAINDSLYNSYDPIASISVSAPATPVYSGSGETDIVYQQGAMPSPSVIGRTWCDDDVDSEYWKCDQTYIRFTTDNSRAYRAVACHETGHAVDLTHGSDAYPVTDNTATILHCMKAFFQTSDYGLGSNNVNEINATY